MPAYNAKLLEQPALALKELGWDLPKGLELHERAVDAERAHGCIAANGWASRLENNGELTDRRDEALKALKTTVVLRLPPPPQEERFSALAVADYDGLSRAYPFTCCSAC